MRTFIDYCKNYIIETIDDFEGTTHYGCDFAYALTQGPNIDGSLTYSREEAKDYLHEWWNECAEYWDYEKDNFGENLHNPFDNPEAYMVCMVVEGVNLILANQKDIANHWNEKFNITHKVIERIKDYVAEWDGDIF